MSNKEPFNYWNRPPSQFAIENEKRIYEIIRQLHEHQVTNGEIKQMQAEGFELKRLESDEPLNADYYVTRPKDYFQFSFIKVFVHPGDAWQDAWMDYAVHTLIPKSINKE